MDLRDAKLKLVGDYVMFATDFSVPVGFEGEKPYRIDEIQEGALTHIPPRFFLVDEESAKRKIHSVYLFQAKEPAVC